MRPIAAAVVALLGAVAAGAPADAATATTRFETRYYLEYPERVTVVEYVADPGEENRLIVSGRGVDLDQVVLEDPRAEISANGDCRKEDEHRVVCDVTTEFGLLHVSAALGDGDDMATAAAPHAAPFEGSVVFDGGPGSDELYGGPATDELDGGGGGRDELYGRLGSDELTDGDADGAYDADLLDGGEDTRNELALSLDAGDTATYQARGAPVTVDLATHRGGAPGEDDELIGIENIWGGAAADLLIGDDEPNGIRGGPGSDVLAGGASRDVMSGDGGEDEANGGEGDDRIITTDKGRDHTACGAGDDVVVRPDLVDLLVDDCEGADLHSLTLSARPLLRGRRVSIPVDCHPDNTRARDCRGRLVLRSRDGGELLARTTYAVGLGRGTIRFRVSQGVARYLRRGRYAQVSVKRSWWRAARGFTARVLQSSAG